MTCLHGGQQRALLSWMVWVRVTSPLLRGCGTLGKLVLLFGLPCSCQCAPRTGESESTFLTPSHLPALRPVTLTSQTDGKLPSSEGGRGELPHYLTPTHLCVWKVLNAAEGCVKAHRLRMETASEFGDGGALVFLQGPAGQPSNPDSLDHTPALPAPFPRAQECVLPTGTRGPSPIPSSKPLSLIHLPSVFWEPRLLCKKGGRGRWRLRSPCTSHLDHPPTRAWLQSTCPNECRNPHSRGRRDTLSCFQRFAGCVYWPVNYLSVSFNSLGPRGEKAADKGSNVTSQGEGNSRAAQPWRAGGGASA